MSEPYRAALAALEERLNRRLQDELIRLTTQFTQSVENVFARMMSTISPLLNVEKPFKFASNVKPVCIPAVPKDNYNANTVVAGWGDTKEVGKDLPHRLRFTTVKILPNERCSKVYHDGYYKKVMYCAYKEGTDSCVGDSGGPLMTLGNGRRYVQVGIVSSGDDCAKIDTPGVYTRVDAFIPWIKQVVRSLRSSDKAYSEQVPLRLASYTVPQWPFFSVPL
ncbi:hypothetical protein HPB49_012529 [Dermacentor silvarum]|uniref:Uncharacterized protein n=1 Tax=Dermacentor silvarum TaxID=543639 RepID=A0ACB8C3K8_DERSI|nr:hypothetical protein HPB49_012529 [Dermacentor silvarum]